MLVTKNIENTELWGGIECTINRVGDNFLDQLAYAGLYQKDIVNPIAHLGIKKLRFPLLWERHQPTLDSDIDWGWTTGQLEELKKKNIDVIAGLLHHGSGPAFTNLLDPNFPELLASYAAKVAAQFPWIEYYTPVNEPLTTARFSGLYGFWYPHQKTDATFLLMLLHQLKGIVLSIREIRKINPAAKLVQTEDLGKTYSTPKLAYQARFENERRWLTYDILCGRLNEKHKLWKYFIKRGKISREFLQFFLDNPCTPDYFGFNHYITSERYLDDRIENYPAHTHGGNKRHRYADVEVARVPIEEETGIKVVLKEAWNRYKQPIAITEVHLHCHREEQLRWFKYVWNSCLELKKEGVAIKGVTAWALFGSYGWNKLLTEPNGDYEAGVYDLRTGYPRPTALTSYIKQLASEQKIEHFLTLKSGWWQRESRFLYPRINTKEVLLNYHHGGQPILILGKNGTLGKAMARICNDRAIHHYLLNRQECDLTKVESIEAAIEKYKPWAIVNAAGYVRVDDAETDDHACFEANTNGPVQLAKICNAKSVKLVSFSSDLVFDGEKQDPYVESDATNPLNIYGKSKADCEQGILKENENALVIRTSAFFGPWDRYNFLHWVEETLSNGLPVTVASDSIVSPTYVPDLVHATLDLLIDDENGIWHLANKGEISWAELAYLTADKNQLNASLIQPVASADMPWTAKRPTYTVLGSEKAHLLPSLQDALSRYFREKKVVLESTQSIAV